MKLIVAEVSFDDRIEEYDVVADDNIRAAAWSKALTGSPFGPPP
jgi:hypothetical protein